MGFNFRSCFEFDQSSNDWLDSLDVFTYSYVEAMFWTEQGNLEESGYDKDGQLVVIPEATRELIEDASSAFQAQFPELQGVRRAGIDFWLTWNRHGAGFWDGDWGEPQATAYTESGREYGEVYVDYDPETHEIYLN